MSLRALIVQSDPKSMQLLARLFHERGDTIQETDNLTQAGELLVQKLPDLMLLDIHYPGNDWFTFLKQTRQRYPQLKIILTASYPDLPREITAVENGINVFLRQPFTRAWLEKAVASALSGGTLPRKKEGLKQEIKVRMPVRIKITVPYLLLALAFALASAYVISQIVLQSVQDRFLSQLVASGHQTADWMVGEEDRMLGTLRLITNTEGMADAVVKQDADTLRSLALPAAVNTNEEAVEILTTQGNALLSMRLKPGGSVGDYEYTRGDTFFATQPFVRQILQLGPDKLGDKYAGLVEAPWGSLFYVGGPVYSAEGKVVGAALVGRTTRTLTRLAAQDTAASITLYNSQGQLLASTVFNDQASYPLSGQQAAQLLSSQDQSSISRSLSIAQVDYTEILGPWEARSGSDLGVVGTALPQTFLTHMSSVTQIEIFILVAIAILLVIGVGVLLAGSITRPLVRLAAASSRVAEGNLDVKVDSHGNDEVAVLAHSFNNMIAGLQEGSMYRDLLGRTVSPEVREQLRQTFTSGNLRLEGQEAVATVLMTDIRGFTNLSEKVEPATVLTWLNEYFANMVPIITANGGVVNKFDGDAMLTFFGILPKRLSPKHGAQAACNAAREILKAVNDLNARRLDRNEPPLITGIGINTGLVIAGGLGSSDRLHYTIIGDTVNTSQRLEALTRQIYTGSGILLGQATFSALAEYASDFQTQPAGQFVVKGKSEKIQVYRLLASEEHPVGIML
jgi:class 3 adenylate cyclase/CheY-like chemotaxis protein